MFGPIHHSRNKLPEKETVHGLISIWKVMCSQGSHVHVHIWSKRWSVAMNQTHSGSLKSLKVGPAAGGLFLQRGCPSLGYMPPSVAASCPGSEVLCRCFWLWDSWPTWVGLGDLPSCVNLGLGCWYPLIFFIGLWIRGPKEYCRVPMTSKEPSKLLSL